MGRDDQGVGQSRHRYQVIPRTLCFVMHGEDVLLLRGGSHKRLWAGLYNGVGGHVEPGEDIYHAAQREVREETGLAVDDLLLGGIIHIDAGDPLAGVLVFVFRATTASKAVTASPEGSLEWVARSALPQEGVVEDLPAILTKLLAMGPCDQPFFAAYHYDETNQLVITFANETQGQRLNG